MHTNIPVKVGCVISCVVALLLTSCGVHMAWETQQKVVTFKVIDKDRGGKDGSYRIYTDIGVFTNADSLWNGKWNSGDVYGQLERKRYYTVTHCGWRWPFLSWFPNILKIHQKHPLPSIKSNGTDD